ncbi:MAG: hypothetical protein QOC81_1080 [Thermoanaerobaculia bacterium]|jgi:hypothetical protein|nr:hypothetical protein [Thermoanaerobaculia bacterium]
MFSIGRAQSMYVVPREHAAAGDIRSRVDRVLRERVLEVLTPIVDAAFTGPAVCLIERLDLDFAFAVDALDDDALAQLWSQEMARGLAAAISKGERVIQFPNRAAFVAQYVIDAAAGRANGRWYYAPFASLAALPTASAIREAITREPDIAFAVVAELARTKRLSTVINALSDRGAREVWESAFPESDSTSDPSPSLIELLLSVWEETVRHDITHTDRGTIARVALRLAAAVLEIAPPSVNAAALRTHIDALLAFAAMLDGTAEPWSLVESIVAGDAAAAVIRAAASDRITDLATLRFLTRLGATRADLVTCAASTIASRFSAQATATPDDAIANGSGVQRASTPRGSIASDIVASRFAALSLLLSPLIDLGLFAAEDEAAQRVLLAARCAGRKHARDVFSDPIALLFAGGDAAMRLDERRDFDSELRGLTTTGARRVAHAVRTLMQSLAARLPGFARSSPAHLRENFLAGEGAIRFDRERIDVYLPPLPLGLVVRIAGMHGRGFAVPWLPDRVVTLLLPESA